MVILRSSTDHDEAADFDSSMFFALRWKTAFEDIFY